MSQDPRIEAAAAVFAEVTGEPRVGRFERTMATAAVAAIDKAATITDEATRRIISNLIDPDECSFDHNNSCQAHGHYYLGIGEKCPNQDAKDWVEAYDARGTE